MVSYVARMGRGASRGFFCAAERSGAIYQWARSAHTKRALISALLFPTRRAREKTTEKEETTLMMTT